MYKNKTGDRRLSNRKMQNLHIFYTNNDLRESKLLLSG